MNENPGVPPLFRDIFKNAYGRCRWLGGQLAMRFDRPKKNPLSNFAAEAAPLKGAVLGWIMCPSAQQALVNANRKLIRRFEAKIKTTIDRVWSAA